MSTITIGTPVYEFVDNEYTEWMVADVVYTREIPHAILETDDERATAPVDDLAAAVSNTDNTRWVPAMYCASDSQWIPHPRRQITTSSSLSDPEEVHLRVAPQSPSDLSFVKLSGEGSLSVVNEFLEGCEDGLVFHRLGSVSTWKAAFAACYKSSIISVAVLHHYHPSTNGEEIAITRLANHETAPKNTSSWMIGKVRKWAERIGYERLAAYTGVGDNDGTCYRAAGLTQDVDVTTHREGTRWEENQSPTDDQDCWTRQKYVDELNPENYANKSDQWAVNTVVDDVISPRDLTINIESVVQMNKHNHPVRQKHPINTSYILASTGG